jgi:thiol-disulfide isomerase/thioredoxin
MSRMRKSPWAAMVLGIGGWIALAASALGADRSAAQILEELDSVKVPKLDARKMQNRSYMHSYTSQRQEAWDKRDVLIFELYKAAPRNGRIPALMAERWGRKDDHSRALLNEIDDVLAHNKDRKLKADGIFIKARAKLRDTRAAGSPDLSLMEEFLELAPQDPRGATLLEMAIEHTRAQKAKAALQARLVKRFPDSPFAMKLHGPRNPKEWVGKPFDLEFTDAVTGSNISVQKLKGKVVVIDFWATWCGPCVAEMPHMKELYAKYRDKGVEFIGVSLDQPKAEGGLENLTTFVEKNGITWPQYYQGNSWKSGFSSSWGINLIPRVFVVDPEGKLHSVEARGKLDTMIPALLKKKAGTVGV